MRLELYRGDISLPDERLKDFDAIACIELIEHLEKDPLERFPENIFGNLQPKLAIITTPNREFNVLFTQLGNKFRHYDHKFEWTRKEFQEWCASVTKRYPAYTFETTGVGESQVRPDVGYCTQISIFRRIDDIPRQSVKLPTNFQLINHFDYSKRTREPEEMKFIDWDALLVN